MLLDNFKKLISFYRSTNFVNTIGNSVGKISFLGGQTGQNYSNHNTTSSPILNNHCVIGVSSFNYDITTGSNSYTDEQASYNWYNITNNTVSNYYDISPYRYNGFILFVGSGDNPVETSDYKLENALVLDVLSASCIHKEDETTIVTRTFQNNTGENVIIKEVGLYMFCSQTSYGTYANENYYVPVIMLGRKVLNTPIIIANNESYTFTYKIDMSQISFAEADN
mgnify:CR=1 FL=1